ncbi:MAG: type II toxin-antitoxin system RelE/ParE family toxin [Spirochaetota bacterium]
MANYAIRFKESVAKDIRKIPGKDIQKILERINTLAVTPRGEGCVKLSGQERYRLRHGVYRIIYEINDMDAVVLVVKVAHRSQVYKSS